MANVFKSVQAIKPVRNMFDESFENIMTTDVGFFRPMALYEIVPGDHFRVNTSCFARLLPMDKPAFAMLDLYFYWFFVPHRLVWDDFEDFITTGLKGTSRPTFPQIALTTEDQDYFDQGSLNDQFGFPVMNNFAQDYEDNISALPFRAYQLIFESFFMDENLFTPRDWSHGSGVVSDDDKAYLGKTRNLNWIKDYFTSALPWAQKGGDVPLGENGVVMVDTDRADNHNMIFRKSDGTVVSSATNLGQAGQGSTVEEGSIYANSVTNVGYIDPNGLYKVNFPTIEQLRNNMRLQEWLEHHAEHGTRYVEQLWGEWHVRSSDARFQRPEFLGGGKQPFVISEVLNQAGDNAQAGLGNFAGKGISAGTKCYFDKFFEEHGYLMGLVGVRPKSLYADGLPKHFKRFDVLDWPFPEFMHLGEQPILSRELYYDGSSDDLDVFGYTGRYNEMRWKGSEVHGLFRDQLDSWHLARLFNDRPGLNNSFLQVTPEDGDRIFPVTYAQGGDRILLDFWHDAKALRPFPKFPTPRL